MHPESHILPTDSKESSVNPGMMDAVFVSVGRSFSNRRRIVLVEKIFTLFRGVIVTGWCLISFDLGRTS